MAMPLENLLDLIAHERAHANSVWNFLLVVHIAIFTGLILAKDQIGVIQRLLVLIGYLGFMYINRNAMLDTYEGMFALIEDVQAVELAPGEYGAATLAYWQKDTVRGNLQILSFIHPVAAVFGSLGIIFSNLITVGPREET